MAKDKKPDPKSKAAPSAPPPQEQQQALPGIQVVSQYIKDLSFENPNAPESLVGGWPAPETNVQIFLRHQVLKENTYECAIHLRVEAKRKDNGKVSFIVDLVYGALVVLHNIAAEQHQPVILVEVPKLLFPFAREIIANKVAQGGYPPLYVTPINFEAIYIHEMKRLQAEQEKKAAG